jgi:hypothetical protein
MEKRILNHPAVESLHREGEDGLWCYLKTGWICPEMECGIIHEYTLHDVWNKLLGVEKKNA